VPSAGPAAPPVAGVTVAAVDIDARLRELGVTLPVPMSPAGDCLPAAHIAVEIEAVVHVRD
jgi:hypothetical protein